ncbi:MAG: helix-turn-helix domain-containing protein [Candidatus Aenigmarchaeota archaeon]|nr:helix-turn-helix domain-containing protein [Candidatus Aenigmarchaeota archaeon]
MLMQKVEGVLEKNGFSYCEYRGCFDIAARKRRVILIKVLNNIDSFSEEQAKNLKIISGEISTEAMVVGSTTRREILQDDIIYERFDIPAMNVNTFESVVENEIPVIYRRRGGLFVDISSDVMRRRRIRSGMSQKELAERVGVTKKSVYEHEKSRLKMSYENALAMERVLGKGIIESAKMDVKRGGEENRPENRFESFVYRNLKKLGFSTSIVRQSPVNIIAEERKFAVMSEADEIPGRIEKNAESLRRFSEISGRPIIAISKSEVDAEIPSVDEKSFRDMSARDIRKFARRW